jgi:Ca2+-binding RTX toxin-like protein
MKIKYPAVRFALRASISGFLAFMLVFFPGGRNVFASCSPASTNGDDTIVCTSASDTVDAQGGNDQITGGSGNDSITGGAGNDSLIGGTGNDVYYFDTDAILGTDIITEAASGGTDRIDFSGSSNSVNVDLGITGNQTVNSNLIVNMTAVQVENITGGSNNDVLTGNALANVISGGTGDDILTGLAGNDILTGGDGIDSMIGGVGNDIYAFDTDTALGIDTITEAASGGTDALNFTGSSNAIMVDLGITGNQFVNSNLILNLTAVQMENVTGGSNNDRITGNAFSNSLTGGAGNDILTGAAGNDYYNFDTDTALGIDTITEISGGGADTLNFSGSTNAITVDMGVIGNQTVNSNLTLNLTAAQVDYITGGSSNDSLTGNVLNNIFTGGAGNDTLIGVAGNDTYNFDTDTALGTDTITEAVGGGTDVLNFSGSTNVVTVDLGLTGSQIVNSNLALNLTAAQMESVIGGNNNDIITGNVLANVLSGGSGNDILNGMGGNDTLNGGAGNDSLIGGTGDDSYAFDTDAALGTDTITEAIGGGTDTLNFSGSSNIVTVDLGAAASQTVNSNLVLNLTAAQMENVTGGTASDNITGNMLNNILSGGTAGNDILNGLDGNDTLTGGAGSDSLLGGAGDDTYAFDADSALGTDTIIEAIGSGTDTLNFTGTSSAITVNLGLANQTVNSTLILNLTAAEMENVIGGGNSDNITGNALNNNLSGGTAGNDILNGMDGNDTLTGGAGTDSLLGGAGNDTYVFDTDTALGTDTITEAIGNGIDTLDFTDSNNIVAINLGTVGSQIVNSNLTLNLTVAQMENVTGGSNNDSISGNALNNVLSGGLGNDLINGMDGADILTGGDGIDTLNGGAGDDQLNGDAGADILNGGDGADALNGGADGDQLNGDTGADILDGGDGADVLNGGADGDQLNGDTGADILDGGDGADVLNGGVDDDQLNGEAGADILDGGDGDDIVNGGDGNDTLISSLGIDSLDGGADDDQLIISGEHSAGDVITGGAGINVFVFQPGTYGSLQLVSNGEDTLDFSLFDSAISIDLNNYNSQNVGGGLSLTLTGLFTSINGTVFNDTITGNSLNNVISGLDGNDTLNGGAGTDTLDGGTDIDMVVEYEAGDAHVSIENGFPIPAPTLAPPPNITVPTHILPTITESESTRNASSIIPVTGAELKPIKCGENPIVLNFHQDSLLVFHNLCNYTVDLNILNDTDILGMEIPENIVSPLAISLNLFEDSNLVDQIPEGSKIIWKIPADLATTVYFLENSTDVEWTQLELNQVDGFYEITITDSGTYLLEIK